MSICMFMARYMYKVWSSYHATYAERKDDDERWIGEFSVLDYACFQVDDRTSSLNPALHPVLGNVNDVYSIQSRIIRHFFFLFFFLLIALFTSLLLLFPFLLRLLPLHHSPYFGFLCDLRLHCLLRLHSLLNTEIQLHR